MGVICNPARGAPAVGPQHWRQQSKDSQVLNVVGPTEFAKCSVVFGCDVMYVIFVNISCKLK